MELHHRGSQRDIIPRPAAATLLPALVVFRFTHRVAEFFGIILCKECCVDTLPLYEDRIHMANGTLFLNGGFSENKDFCRNRLPVAYNPDAAKPAQWLAFLSQLLYPEDIPTLREFFGYCLIPSTRGQKMLLLTASPEFFQGKSPGR